MLLDNGLGSVGQNLWTGLRSIQTWCLTAGELISLVRNLLQNDLEG